MRHKPHMTTQSKYRVKWHLFHHDRNGVRASRHTVCRHACPSSLCNFPANIIHTDHYSWLCHRLPCCLTPALLMSVTRPHTCFACVCDRPGLTPALCAAWLCHPHRHPSISDGTAMLPHTCFACVGDQAVNMGRYCHVASHLLCLCR